MQRFVLDHESTDETVSIASARGARVMTRSFAGFVEARRFAVSQVQTPWTLMIDADERPDSTLCAAMLDADGAADGYFVSRTTYYCGKPLRMWRGERLLRLFRTHAARLEPQPAAGGQAQLHERWVCDGRVELLPGTLEHFSYSDAQSYREKYERYTDMESRGVHPGLDAAVLLQALLAPLRFVRLLCKGAALDGPQGWYVAWKSAVYPTVVRWKAFRRS
jgi:glycosyltransferase involved in cell wall biosynthesis